MKHKDILKKMTLEEKCALLGGAGEWNTRTFPHRGVPEMHLSDGPNGIRKQEGAGDHLGLNASVPATCWPTAATVAASWDLELAEQIGQALGEEAAACDVNVLLGPGLNIKRSPLCGRNFEYFSEDPLLAGKMAAAYVRGEQSQGISACPKHFAVNSQEMRRMASNSIVDERTLREIYLTGFEIALEEGQPKTIMSSYNLVNDAYANENMHLMVDILRKDWKYDGVVVTDWGGSNSHVDGVKAGSDLEMPGAGLGSVRELIDAVHAGTLSEHDVDVCADRLIDLILTTHIEQPAGKDGFDKEGHHALARRAAGECAVLLKNEEQLLPLASGQKVTVIGDFAKNPRYQGAGSSMVNPTKLDTFLDTMEASGLVLERYVQGYKRNGEADEALAAEAVEAAKSAEVVVFFLGLDEMKESEGLDRADMKIGASMVEVLKRVSEVNKNVVCVLCGGSSVETQWSEYCSSLLYLGLGGQAGAGACADLLAGKINPSGKLAESWAKVYEDTPTFGNFPGKAKNTLYKEGLYVGYRYFDTAGVPVSYPFGYGLSYTTFAYSDLTVTSEGVDFTITNTGAMAGKEVAQLYVGRAEQKKTAIYRPKKELKGFVKVALEPGESKRVHIAFDKRTFRFFNTQTNRFENEGGLWTIYVGADSLSPALVGELTVRGTDVTSIKPKKEMIHYETAAVHEVSDAEFSALIGRPIPEDQVKIDRNITFGQLNHGRSPIGWLIWLVMTLLMRASEKSGKPNLNILFIYNMPMRALAKMSGGAFNMGMVDALVMEFKGFWIIGLVRLIAAFVIKTVKDSKLAATLKAQAGS